MLVYQATSHSKVTIVQLRSAVPPAKSQLFASSVREWIESVPFRDVIILSGADATGRGDRQIEHPCITYYSPFKSILCYEDTLKGLPWSRIDTLTETNSSGTGMIKYFVKEFEDKDSKLPLLALMWYTVEGGKSASRRTLYSTPLRTHLLWI